MNNPDQTVSFRPGTSQATIRFRARLVRRIREYFDADDFVEVQTPVLSRDSVIDRFVEPLSLTVEMPGGNPELFYLLTSPEFAMKRLLAAGMDAIYQMTPVFRAADRGPAHNIEFTMLEWYRAGHEYKDGIMFLARLVDDLFQEAIRSFAPCRIFPVEEVLFQRTGLTFGATCDDYLRFARHESLNFPDSFLSGNPTAEVNDWFDFIFSEVIQPQLGLDSPVILFDYPATQSQLAQTRSGLLPTPFANKYPGQTQTERAERYELFVSGLELANGYHELLDADILRQRNEETQKQRMADGKPYFVTSGKLLAAMDSGLPPSCGCALGLERLLMALLDTRQIDDVIPFPIEEA
ncbi:MAG: EF-P lysine aminoacylase GenX [Thermoguttaceae bacterium]|nr:EF-P lysine aminoacylase GenX [Thermoguttaceae bacterium]